MARAKPIHPKSTTQTESKTQTQTGYSVGVYARVSTLHADQQNSFIYQSKNIPRMLEEDDRVYKVFVYKDEGKTATHKESRPEFLRMVNDARLGKIDIIVCKNVSRFARNLADAIATIQELKDSGIRVYFIEEHMDTQGENFAMMFSLLSVVSAQESESLSSHVKQTFTHYIQEGIKVNKSSPYGYDCVNVDTFEKRKLIPNSDAKIVREIFDRYLNGQTTTEISKALELQGIHKRGSTICQMLHNEAYCGILVQGKQFVDGVRGPKKWANSEHLAYEVKNAHQGIVTVEEFEKVQELMKRRQRSKGAQYTGPLTGLIHCGRCGSTYIRRSERVWNKTEKEKTGKFPYTATWACGSFQKATKCEGKTIKAIYESVLKSLYKDAVNLLKGDADKYKGRHYTQAQINAIGSMSDDFQDIHEVVKDIVIGTKKVDNLVRFVFKCGVSVEFETTPTDVRYKTVKKVRLRS